MPDGWEMYHLLGGFSLATRNFTYSYFPKSEKGKSWTSPKRFLSGMFAIVRNFRRGMLKQMSNYAFLRFLLFVSCTKCKWKEKFEFQLTLSFEMNFLVGTHSIRNCVR